MIAKKGAGAALMRPFCVQVGVVLTRPPLGFMSATLVKNIGSVSELSSLTLRVPKDIPAHSSADS